MSADRLHLNAGAATSPLDQLVKPDQLHASDNDQDDEKRRRFGYGGGGINPANANYGFNVRPDVVEGPAGLEVRTTMKSVDYRAEVNASGDARPPTSEADRGANQPPLTLDLIARDPWNAVELPLPANADEVLLKAARSAAEYCAEGHHELMTAAIEGRYAPPGWTGAEGEPDAHEYDEARWLQAGSRLSLINERLDQMQGIGDAPDTTTQRANEESTKRQDAERAARASEGTTDTLATSAPDSFAADLRSAEKAARLERERGEGSGLSPSGRADNGREVSPVAGLGLF